MLPQADLVHFDIRVTVGAFFIAVQFPVSKYGRRWWCSLVTIVNGVATVLAFLSDTETAHD